MSEVLALRPRDAREMAMVVARFGGSTLEEIGGEFGVSRERARQILERAGVEKAMLADRPLFTSKNNAIPREVFARQDAVAAERERYWGEVRRRQHAARRERVEQLRALAAKLGRAPTLGEFALSLGIKLQSLACVTMAFATRTIGPQKTPYPKRTARLYRAAGLPIPRVGAAGHVFHKDWGPERREVVRIARQLAAAVGGVPSIADISRVAGYSVTPGGVSGYGAAIRFANGGNTRQTKYRDAARRLYRAAGILRPYGWAPSLDQRHGAY